MEPSWKPEDQPDQRRSTVVVIIIISSSIATSISAINITNH
jgi:hypothetical protein